MNRLTDIKLNGSGTSAVTFTYNDLSQRTQMAYSNGATVDYTPQLNEDVTTITHSFVGSSVVFTYGYNDVHEPNSVHVSDDTYMYYPAAANTTYATADSVNKYPTVGGTSYSYDGNKNLTGDGVWTYGYDTENHMLTAAKTGVSASFVYDPMERQSQKTVGSVKSRYIYSEWQRIADYDGTAGTLQNRYVYGTSLDEPLIQVSSAGVLTFLHADKMGSIIATSDNSGAVTNKNLYSPFGEIVTLGGTTFGFTGQRYDSELGLSYYKRRMYSPKLGRFLQPDPIGYAGSKLNLYAYVGNSPLKYRDPMGLQGVVYDPGYADEQMANALMDAVAKLLMAASQLVWMMNNPLLAVVAFAAWEVLMGLAVSLYIIAQTLYVRAANARYQQWLNESERRQREAQDAMDAEYRRQMDEKVRQQLEDERSNSSNEQMQQSSTESSSSTNGASSSGVGTTNYPVPAL